MMVVQVMIVLIIKYLDKMIGTSGRGQIQKIQLYLIIEMKLKYMKTSHMT